MLIPFLPLLSPCFYSTSIGILLRIFIPPHILLLAGCWFYHLTDHWFNSLGDALLSKFWFSSSHCFFMSSFAAEVANIRFMRTKSPEVQTITKPAYSWNFIENDIVSLEIRLA
ncbi:unnamed protein product [Hymenolepis diminuta]|uniref:Uncharacterized protein n=1 Tax=Hymenolepis diminuta TaxID=6216 RepID=A0A564Z621_HYMDI|nr:unnamed protein product [Hymenolepis diminuta]